MSRCGHNGEYCGAALPPDAESGGVLSLKHGRRKWRINTCLKLRPRAIDCSIIQCSDGCCISGWMSSMYFRVDRISRCIKIGKARKLEGWHMRIGCDVHHGCRMRMDARSAGLSGRLPIGFDSHLGAPTAGGTGDSPAIPLMA
jgi:hypothetical protein